MSADAPVVTGLYAAGALILASAGASKVLRPGDSSVALRAAGLPATAGRVRFVALIEVAIAGAALTMAGPVPALLVAASYLAFSGFVAVALHRRLPLASCGCFGRPDTPPSLTHLVVNIGAAAAAMAWAASASRPLTVTFSQQSWRALPLGLGAIVVSGLTAVLLTNPLARAGHARSEV